MESDHQRPRSWIILPSTRVQSRAMVPEAWRDLAEMSEGERPRWGPRRVVANCRVSVMVVGARATGPNGRKVVARGVWLGAWCWQRWRTWLIGARTGQK